MIGPVCRMLSNQPGTLRSCWIQQYVRALKFTACRYSSTAKPAGCAARGQSGAVGYIILNTTIFPAVRSGSHT